MTGSRCVEKNINSQPMLIVRGAAFSLDMTACNIRGLPRQYCHYDAFFARRNQHNPASYSPSSLFAKMKGSHRNFDKSFTPVREK